MLQPNFDALEVNETYYDCLTKVCVRVCVGGFRVSASVSLKTPCNRDEREDLLISVEAWSLQR